LVSPKIGGISTIKIMKLFCIVFDLYYLCIMKKEFGKWLMDIAKYMVTALLLSTIFAEMNDPIIIYVVVILSAIVLAMGLYWVGRGEKDNTIKKKKKK